MSCLLRFIGDISIQIHDTLSWLHLESEHMWVRYSMGFLFKFSPNGPTRIKIHVLVFSPIHECVIGTALPSSWKYSDPSALDKLCNVVIIFFLERFGQTRA